MFDDFREQAEESTFEESEELELDGFIDEPAGPRQYFLGMTPVQRFIISVELLFMVCITGAFVLLVLGRVYPPFLN